MIKWQCSVFLLLCILALELIPGSYEQEVINVQHSKYHVDYFVLAMEWPQGICEYTNATHRHECVVPAEVPGWVLHGLWPSIKGHKYLQYCNRSAKFDYNKVKDMESDLHKYWPNLFKDSSKMFLWKHEYEKHGTCAALVKGFETEREYFSKAMEFLHKYDPEKVLKSAGIVPSVKAYASERIIKTTNKVYGVRVYPQCSYYGSENDGVRAVTGVEICMTKGLELMDCLHEKTKYHCNGDVFYHPLHYRG